MKNNIKIIASILLCGVMLLSGCSGSQDSNTGTQSENSGATVNAAGIEIPMKNKITKSKKAGNSGDVKLEAGDTYAVISVKDYGDITVKLYPEEAPYAVYNFTELAKSGAYNGRYFHRIVDDFMVQGGSLDANGTGGQSFDGGSFKNEINTSLRHYYGALCFASALGSISDQFYIVNCKTKDENVEELYKQYIPTFEKYVEAYKEQLANSEKGTQQYTYYSRNYEFYNLYSTGAQAMADTVTDSVKETYSTRGGKPMLDGGYTVFGQTVDGFDVIDALSAVEKTTGASGENSKPVIDVVIEKVEIFTK